MKDAAGSAWLAEHAAAVDDAAALVAPHVRRTPVVDISDVAPGALAKAESLQRTGSFKVRGAFNAVLRLAAAGRPRGVIAVSSGNHGQAVALAAAHAGLPAVVVMPQGSNPAKVAATRALGAEVVSEGVDAANREAVVRRLAQERSLVLVHPFDDWDVIHGQATVAREVLADRPDAGLVVVPVGGGGLLSGTALSVRASGRPALVVGVEPAAADDAARSLREHRRVALDRVPATIADGTRSLSLGERTYEVIVERGLVDDIVTVSEEEIAEAVRVAALRCRLVLEPSGALPLAAALAGRLPAPPPGTATVLVLSGGNVDPTLLARVLGGG